MDPSALSVPIPEDVLDVIAERVADLVVERLGRELHPSSGRWMRTAEAAAYVGLTRSALYGRIGDIPHHKIDRLLLFKREDLDEWLDRYRREPGKPGGWVPQAPYLTRRPRARARRHPEQLLPVGPNTKRKKPAPRRERPLPPPLGGDEAQKNKWAWELEITRAELDAMSPKDFKRAWDARNDRLRDGGVFERIGELMDQLGTKALDEMQPSALIRAAQELEPK